MDPLAARAANALAGNPEGAPLLEMTGPGAELLFEAERRVALAGADLGAAIAPFRATVLAAGARLRFSERRRGARAYLAVAGGLAVRAVFGSAATDLAAGLGGATGDGRPLRAGDRLTFGPSPAAPPATDDLDALAAAYADAGRLRFLPAAAVDDATVAAFAAGSYVVTPRSSRSGYRLDGPPVALPSAGERLSEPIAPGTIQVPPDGLPILLMADRQTVGGYPAVGYLARADVPKAAQLWPGDRVRFVPISLDEAQAAARPGARRG
jgi:antagonist of KipI